MNEKVCLMSINRPSVANSYICQVMQYTRYFSVVACDVLKPSSCAVLHTILKTFICNFLLVKQEHSRTAARGQLDHDPKTQ